MYIFCVFTCVHKMNLTVHIYKYKQCNYVHMKYNINIKLKKKMSVHVYRFCSEIFANVINVTLVIQTNCS